MSANYISGSVDLPVAQAHCSLISSPFWVLVSLFIKILWRIIQLVQGFFFWALMREACVVCPGHGLGPSGPTVTSSVSCPSIFQNAQKYESTHQSLLELLQARAGALGMVSLKRISLPGPLFHIEAATSWVGELNTICKMLNTYLVTYLFHAMLLLSTELHTPSFCYCLFLSLKPLGFWRSSCLSVPVVWISCSLLSLGIPPFIPLTFTEHLLTAHSHKDRLGR